MAQLKIERDVSARRALILSLGGYEAKNSSPTERQELIGLYLANPDPGIHSAIEWSLRRWDEGSLLQRYNQSLAGRKQVTRDWYVTREGQTMVIVRNPPEFTAGS